MAYEEIPISRTDAQSPLDELLTEGPAGYNTNIKDHESRILDLEAESATSTESLIGKIFAGLQDNTAMLRRKRFNVADAFTGFQRSTLDGSSDITGEDPASRWIGLNQLQNGDNWGSNADYLGKRFLQLAKNSKLSFKLKRGENYFGIIYAQGASVTDAVTITVDGVAVNDASLALTDQFGTAHSATFTTVAGINLFQTTTYFLGLNPDKERTITIENTDSGTDVLNLNGIEVGFLTPPGVQAIALNDVRMAAGIAEVRGSTVTIDETSLSFAASTGYGKTDVVAADTEGVVSTIAGIEPANTQVKPGETIDPSTTSIKVKNHFFFPSTGFLSIMTPYGQYVVASYNAKSNGTYASFDEQSFDGLLWSSKIESITVLDGFDSGENSFTGDVNINLLGGGGLAVSAANNKIDFKLKVDADGSAQTYAATIANGLYSSNLIPLGTAIIEAMETAKSLPDGTYFCDWDENTHKWSIGVRGSSTVTEFELLFLTGTNVANSIHTDIGYTTTDLSAALSYIAVSEKEHKAVRCQELGHFEHPDSQNCKYEVTSEGTDQDKTETDQIKTLTQQGFRPIYTEDETLVKIYTDPDATGCMFYFVINDEGSYIKAQIDNGDHIYILQTDSTDPDDSGIPSRIVSAYISFPRGSKVVTLTAIDSPDQMIDNTGTNPEIIFLGFRQIQSRAPFEKLTIAQGILRQYDIQPLRLFKSYYADNYTPAGSLDNVDSISFTGTWTSHNALTTGFNGFETFSSASGDTVDIQFTLAGDGGGVGLMGVLGTSCKEAEFYLNAAAAASEAAGKLIRKHTLTDYNTNPDQEYFTIMGLPAGTYTLRAKIIDTVKFPVSAFFIIDTIDPDEDSINNSELTNNGQSPGFPINVTKLPFIQDGTHKLRSDQALYGDYNLGSVALDYRVENHTGFDDHHLSANIRTNTVWYGGRGSSNVNTAYYGSFFHAMSVHSLDSGLATYTTAVTPNYDGRSDSSYDQGTQTKSGGAPSTLDSSHNPLSRKYYQRDLSGDMSDSTTVVLDDTRGFRVGQTINISADGETTVTRRVSSISADTSVTINTAIAAFANFTTANNARVDFSGFHALRMDNDAALLISSGGLAFEPLPVLIKNNYMEVQSIQRFTGQRLNYIITNSSGSFSSSSDADIPNLATQFKTHGNPVFLCMISDVGAVSELKSTRAGNSITDSDIVVQRDSVSIGTYTLGHTQANSGGNELKIPTSSVQHFDFPPAGNYEYKFRASPAGANTISVTNVRMLILEIPFDLNSFHVNPYDLIKDLL